MLSFNPYNPLQSNLMMESHYLNMTTLEFTLFNIWPADQPGRFLCSFMKESPKKNQLTTYKRADTRLQKKSNTSCLNKNKQKDTNLHVSFKK